MQKLRIFAASPADVATERAKVARVVETLKPLADSIDMVLEVVDWRQAVPDVGRPQQIIFDQLQPTSWEVLIGILWHRFGTPPGGADPHTQREYLSGTEEEFRTAYRLWQQYKRPRIMMYRCTRAIPLEALDPDQFKRVKEFFTQFDTVKGEHPGLYQSVDTAEAFERLLLDNLQRLLLSYNAEERQQPLSPHTLPVLAAPPIPNNLPPRAAFFGREEELHKVLGTLSPAERGWGVVLDGIGGIGKTALAVEAAYCAQERGMFDAFIFVSAKDKYLAPEGIREQSPAARTLDDFVNETARVLGEPGITQLPGDSKQRALLDALRGTRALLIYDNLETLTKEEQEVLADFLRFLPQNSKAMLTSRRRGGEGALWLRLDKLAWDAAHQIIANEAHKSEQLHAKLQPAQARWPDLYDETKGSPLALVHVLGLMRTRVTLTFDGALALLRGNRDADLQQFIFQEARKELGVSDIAVLRALSFFQPSASFEALPEVADVSRNVLALAIDRLDALSLLDSLEGTERYALHPLTRNFVRDELLAEAHIAHQTGMRFARYWVAYAQRYGSEQYKAFPLLEAEWGNLDAAAGWLWQTAAVHGDGVGNKDAAQMLNELAAATAHFLWFGGRWDEHVQLNARVYEAMRALNEWRNAGWRAFQVAWIYSIYVRNLPEPASVWVDRCVEAWARGGSKYGQATGVRMRGLVALQRKDYDAAEQLLQDALAIYRDMQLDGSVAIVLTHLGNLERSRKAYDAAERYYHKALALTEKNESKEGMATLYSHLGTLARNRERWGEARERYEKALALAREKDIRV